MIIIYSCLVVFFPSETFAELSVVTFSRFPTATYAGLGSIIIVSLLLQALVLWHHHTRSCNVPHAAKSSRVRTVSRVFEPVVYVIALFAVQTGMVFILRGALEGRLQSWLMISLSLLAICAVLWLGHTNRAAFCIASLLITSMTLAVALMLSFPHFVVLTLGVALARFPVRGYFKTLLLAVVSYCVLGSFDLNQNVVYLFVLLLPCTLC